ncbi:hypothetical protein BDZ45DRAFT_416723 [Acephala macrosclerotiorum]|nr:hypothetical protein BDZ45DRAFT_416723 [Acephala macrosclerotiorum]
MPSLCFSACKMSKVHYAHPSCAYFRFLASSIFLRLIWSMERHCGREELRIVEEMRENSEMKVAFILFASSILASPVLEKRDVLHCLEASGVWTSFVSSTSTPLWTQTSASALIHTTISTPPILSTAAAVINTPSPSAYTSAAALPAGTLHSPSPSTWSTDNGTKWHITPLDPIYSSTLLRLDWDIGRTSTLFSTLSWNFGGVQSFTGLQDGFP